MAKVAEACEPAVYDDVMKNNTIGPELHGLRNLDPRILERDE